jgi:hypothetical protein
LALFVVLSRAHARFFSFLLFYGLASVTAYHVMGQRSQSVDTKKIDPIGGAVDRMGPNLHLSARAGTKTKPNQTMAKILKEPAVQFLAVWSLASLGGMLWASADSAARYKRCQASHPVEHCRLVYFGR